VRTALTTPSAQARAAAGKARRAAVPRSSHAELPTAQHRDPNALLAAVAERRLHFLIPLRNERMAETPFTFYRGAAVVMAADLVGTPSTGITVQACGDAHCLNFGGYASPERNLLFDVNDFDETLPGPWEWDLKRLVTSIVIAARANSLRKRDVRAAALATAAAYRVRLRELAALPALDVWYLRLDAARILDEAKTFAARRARSKIAEQVATDSIRETVDKLTVGSGMQRRFKDDPPLLFHSERTESHGFDVDHIFAEYRTTLPDDMRHLFDRYRRVDDAIKVVGVGSVGTRCAIALFAADDHDPLLLQIKEAVPSVLEASLPKSAYANHGERVVRGQRLMQTASDAFLGWASSGKHDFYVRQFKDMKASANLDHADAGQITLYGRYCAYALAMAHARSGDAAGIAGYLGVGTTMDEALLAFGLAYADRNAGDYERFVASLPPHASAATSGAKLVARGDHP
jgi:uncharacterized protein (DUF2252 family)